MEAILKQEAHFKMLDWLLLLLHESTLLDKIRDHRFVGLDFEKNVDKAL